METVYCLGLLGKCFLPCGRVFLSLSYAIFLSRFSFGKTMGLRECCFLPMLTCSDVSCDEDLFLTLTSTKRSTCTGVGICFNEQIHIAK